VWNLPSIPWEVPHRKSYVVDRQDLFRHIEQEDLDLNPEQVLALSVSRQTATVILLLRPTNEQLLAPAESILGKYWRRLFHASVHLELEDRWHDGRLTLAKIRQRIEEIGLNEFREFQKTLVDDRYLPARAPEHQVYIEFAAVFLELLHFSANLLPIY